MYYILDIIYNIFKKKSVMLDAIKIYYKSTEAQQAKHNILSGHIFLHEICEVYSLL